MKKPCKRGHLFNHWLVVQHSRNWNPASRIANPKLRALVYLHTAVFLWGFTAILGKLISYSSIILVWHRMCLTVLVYFLFPAVWRSLKSMSLRDVFVFLGIGCIVCAHWLTFYGSIKLGNSASVTLACLGSASFFSALLEPIMGRKKVKWMEILLGILVLAGIFIIYKSLPQEKNHSVNLPLAILTGVISAFLAAFFTVLNKMNIQRTDPLTLSALEMLGGAALLTVVVPFAIGSEAFFLPEFNLQTGNFDLLWILVLVLVCTNFTFYLGTHSLQYLSAFTSNLSVNLEPIYGIVLGAIIFKENQNLNIWFYMGTALILVSVFAQSFLEYYNRRKDANANTELIIRE